MNIQPISQNCQSGYTNKNVSFCSTINPRNFAEGFQRDLRALYHKGYWDGKIASVEPHPRNSSYKIPNELWGGNSAEDIGAIEKLVAVMSRLYDVAFSTGQQSKPSQGLSNASLAREEIAKIYDGLKKAGIASKLREAVEDNLPKDY